MAVLQHDPMASHSTALNVLLGSVSHALTKGEKLELVLSKADNVDKFLHVIEGVGTWAENEDNRSLLGGLVIDLLVVDGRRLHVVVVHLVDDEVLDCVYHAVGAEDSYNQ